jgi:hypothetical protein
VNLTESFLPAFMAILEEFAENGYFVNRAGSTCSDGHGVGWDEELVRRHLTKYLGKCDWPIDLSKQYSNEILIGYIEAFFTFVALPSKSWYHDFCKNYHPIEFDTAAGRYNYTVEINAALGRFKTGLRIVSGRVQSLESPIFRNVLVERIPCSGDKVLEQMLDQTIAFYLHGGLQNKWMAVQGIADVVEYVKKIIPAENVKKSAEKLVLAMSPVPALNEELNAHFGDLSKLVNEMNIRHHGPGQTQVHESEALLDFLFLAHFNLVRFSLNVLEGQQDSIS